MRCDDLSPWLSAYLDGELDRERSSKLEGHLSGCASCSDELASLRGSVALIRSMEMEEPPQELRPRILTAIRATRPSPWAWVLSWTRLPATRVSLGLGLAGTAALVGLVFGPGLTRIDAPSAPKERPVVAVRPKPVTPRQSRIRTARETVKRLLPALAKPASGSPVGPPLLASTLGASGEAATARPNASRVNRAKGWRIRNDDAASLRRTTLAKNSRSLFAAIESPERPNPRNRAPIAQGGGARSRQTLPPPGSGRVTSSDRRETPAVDLMPPEPTRAPEGPPDDPMMMMASMPMSGAAGSGGTSPAVDPLSSLRQRLADERRELPRAALEVLPHNARTAPVPSVRIEF